MKFWSPFCNPDSKEAPCKEKGDADFKECVKKNTPYGEFELTEYLSESVL